MVLLGCCCVSCLLIVCCSDTPNHTHCIDRYVDWNVVSTDTGWLLAGPGTDRDRYDPWLALT